MELNWLIASIRGKSKKATIMKLAAAKTIYEVWKYGNDICYGNNVDNNRIVDTIIDKIVHRGWV